MGQEKSYDSLPNFTAVDCLRWAGAVIEHVNNLQPTTAHPNTQVSIIWAFFPLSSLPESCLKVLQKFDVFEMLWFEFRSRFCYESGFHRIFQNGSESMRNRIRNTDPTGSTEFNRHFLLLCTDCWAVGIGRNQYIDLMNQTQWEWETVSCFYPHAGNRARQQHISWHL